MLNNLTNFFNLIVGRRIKTTLEDSDLIAIGTKQSPALGDYKPTAIKFEDLKTQLASGGGGSAPVNITYSDLYSNIVNSELVPGTIYRITDYKSVNFLNGWNIAKNNPTPIQFSFNPREIYEGDEEVLLVQALSTSELSPTAYSETYTGDILEYQAYTNKIGVDLEISNGQTLPNSSTVSGFDIQWDGTNAYFNMPTGYPALFGHYFYLYAEFETLSGVATASLNPGSVPSTNYSTYFVSGTSITGTGVDAVFEIKNSVGGYQFQSIVSNGYGYSVGDQVLILGSQLGGVDGVNDLILTVDSLVLVDYYQDGVFEPLTPGICECQYPYTSNDIDHGIPKTMSRVQVVNNGTKVLLLDLTQFDVGAYQPDTLYIDTVYALGDAYGWVTRRNDTERRINVPFDFRGRKYRRYEVDLTPVNSGLGTGYYGRGDNFLGQGTTGKYKDLPIFFDSIETYDIQWQGSGGPNAYWYAGLSDNNVCVEEGFYMNNFGDYTYDNTFSRYVVYNNSYSTFYGNTIQGSFSNNTCTGFALNTIAVSFYNNQINSGFTGNRITNTCFYNIFDDIFAQNITTDAFRRNTIKTNVTNVNFTGATHVYGNYTCDLFTRSNGSSQLSYVDGTNTVQYTAITA